MAGQTMTADAAKLGEWLSYTYRRTPQHIAYPRRGSRSAELGTAGANIGGGKS